MLSRGRTQLIPFLMAGDPSLGETLRFARALIEEGAAALEIGVPFSDPVADGPVLQRSADRALRHRTSLSQVLELTAQLHREFPTVPLIVFSYANPIFAMGTDEYVRRAKASGVRSTLVVDMPFEEASEFLHASREQGLGNVFLISPTTAPHRAHRMSEVSEPFTYFVTRTGVTGTRSELPSNLREELARARSATVGPLAAGFGISTGEQAAALNGLVEAVIVGSAFVRLIEEAKDPQQAEHQIRRLAREIRAALTTGEIP